MRTEARLAASTLSALAMLLVAKPAYSQEVDPDEVIDSQLQGALAGDEFTLINPQMGYLARFPWIGGEFDLTLVTSEGGRFLGFAIETDCVFEALKAEDELHPTFFPGIYHPDKRLQSMDIHVVVPEVVPTRPIWNTTAITESDINYDCHETSAVEDIVPIIREIDENLPSTAEGGARRVGSVARAIFRGLTKSR